MIKLAELTWPTWMDNLVKAICEGLPESEAAQFKDLLESVPVGVDLESMEHVVAIKRMDRLISQQEENNGYINKGKILSALRAVRQCHESELKNEACDWESARSAASAAWSKLSELSSERSAERSAEWKAEWAAVQTVELSAERSELSVGWAAEWAAWSDEWTASAAWEAERDALLEAVKDLAGRPACALNAWGVELVAALEELMLRAHPAYVGNDIMREKLIAARELGHDALSAYREYRENNND